MSVVYEINSKNLKKCVHSLPNSLKTSKYKNYLTFSTHSRKFYSFKFEFKPEQDFQSDAICRLYLLSKFFNSKFVLSRGKRGNGQHQGDIEGGWGLDINWGNLPLFKYALLVENLNLSKCVVERQQEMGRDLETGSIVARYIQK